MIITPALLGLMLCLFNAAGAEMFCVTTGCSIYAGFSLFGLSFYTLGAAGFAVILLLGFFSGKSAFARALLYGTILAGLLLDMVLLAWQLLYWPCSSCLVVAVLLGAAALGFSCRFKALRRGLLKATLLVWLALLIPSAVAAGKEIMLSPWRLYGAPEADIQVFFSPTCPACSSEVAKLLNATDIDRLAFYPVAKNEQDVRMVAAFLEQGALPAQDLVKLFAIQPDPSLQVSFELRWQLARNKMVLARRGGQSIPYIISQAVIERPRPAYDQTFSTPGLFEVLEPKGCGPVEPSCE
jgi:hypothetical protein